MIPNLTTDPSANRAIAELFEAVQTLLGERLVAFYLEGSLAAGGFDEDSDIDFCAVLEEEATPGLFEALSAMHARFSQREGYWMYNFEGSYLSKAALRKDDPDRRVHPNIERGRLERLKWLDLGQSWDVHRSILRAGGIALSGPPPQALIDPVPANSLRRASLQALHGWMATLLSHPEQIEARGFQSYIVLSLCRVRYTLRIGKVASKQGAARWVLEHGGERWAGLIERAWVGRHNSNQPAEAGDIQETLDLLQETIAQAGESPIRYNI